jgi:hypothetical protein
VLPATSRRGKQRLDVRHSSESADDLGIAEVAGRRITGA